MGVCFVSACVCTLLDNRIISTGQIAALAESSELRLSANISVLSPAESSQYCTLEQIGGRTAQRPESAEKSITIINDVKWFKLLKSEDTRQNG